MLKKMCLALLIPLLVGCGNSDPVRGDSASTTGGTSSSTASTASTTPPTSETTTPTSTVGGNDVAVEGMWYIPAEEILAANMANLGPMVFECDGQVTMLLQEGHIRHSGTATCTMPSSPVVADGIFDSEGSYSIDGDRMTVTDVETNGFISLNGREMAPINSLTSMTSTVKVEGDTLTLTFTQEDVGTVTQVWHRGS